MIKYFRNKLVQSLAILAVLGLSYSCSDEFFDGSVGDRILPKDHYKTVEELFVSMDGVLAELQDVAAYKIMIDGLRSDQMVLSESADAHWQEINNHNASLDNPYIDPSAYYRTIINVNEVLQYVDTVSATDQDFPEIYAFDAKSVLKGMKAWAYLNLVRQYGTVAWIPDNMATMPEGNIETLNKADLLDRLINELKPYIYDKKETRERDEALFFSFPNSKAVLGELYLEQNDYENAIYYLKLAIETKVNIPRINEDLLYKIDKSYSDIQWRTLFFNSENQLLENIMVIPYNAKQKQENLLAKWMLPENDFIVKPSKVLIDSLNNQQNALGTIETDLYRGYFTTFDSTASGEAYINKYNIDATDPYSADIILFRSADIHLLLAEALNRTEIPDNMLIALALINGGIKGMKSTPAGFSDFRDNIGVRGRVQLKPREIPDGRDMTIYVELIEDYIIEEKAMECAFEGNRMSDLIRVAKRRANPGEYLGSKVANKFLDPGKAGEIKARLMTEANWYLPFE